MDKIVCVGKNYLEHARELGDAVPKMPVLFLKPPSVLSTAANWGDAVILDFPSGRGELHYECEIVLRLGRGGSIASVTLGLDMTLRTIQAQLKKDGHPWTLGKVFSGAAVIGPEIPLAQMPDYLDQPFSFSLGTAGHEQVKQLARGREMTMLPEDLIRYASECFPLCEGDLIFTGTPAGVGPVNPGDRGTLSWGGRSFSVRWNPTAG